MNKKEALYDKKSSCEIATTAARRAEVGGSKGKEC